MCCAGGSDIAGGYVNTINKIATAPYTGAGADDNTHPITGAYQWDNHGMVTQTGRVWLPNGQTGGQLDTLAPAEGSVSMNLWDSTGYRDSMPWSLSGVMNGRHYAIVYGSFSSNNGGSGFMHGRGRDLWAWDPDADQWAFVRTLGVTSFKDGQLLGTAIVMGGQLLTTFMTGTPRDQYGADWGSDGLMSDQDLYVWPGVQFITSSWSFSTAPLANSLAALTFSFTISGQLNPGSVVTIAINNVRLINNGVPVDAPTRLSIAGVPNSAFDAKVTPLSPRESVLLTANWSINTVRASATAQKLGFLGVDGRQGCTIRPSPVMDFDGSQQYLDLMDPKETGALTPFPSTMLSQFTVSTWLYRYNDTGNSRYAFYCGPTSEDATPLGTIGLRIDGFDFPGVLMADGTVANGLFATSGAHFNKRVPQESWFSLVWTMNGPNIEIWINGLLHGSAQAPYALRTMDRPYCYFGRSMVQATSTAHWKGQLAEFAFFSRVLTQPEIEALGFTPPAFLMPGTVTSVEANGGLSIGSIGNGDHVLIHGSSSGCLLLLARCCAVLLCSLFCTASCCDCASLRLVWLWQC